jgi:hypothetical protein
MDWTIINALVGHVTVQSRIDLYILSSIGKTIMQPRLHRLNPIMISTLILMAALSSPTNAAFQSQTLTGWLDTYTSDPLPGSTQPSEYHATLSDGHGTLLAELVIDSTTAEAYRGQQVTITGQSAGEIGAAGSAVPFVTVQTITALTVEPEMSAQGMTSAQPYVNLLCKFSDIPDEPFPPAHYAPVFSDTYPGLDHYFRQISYNNMNLVGTVTATQWYVLPHPKSSYLYLNVVYVEAMANDCAQVADADYYFPDFRGINIFLNSPLDCCARGGTITITIDGQTRSYRAIWIPPVAARFDIIVHEMGHGLGFPHSTGPANNPPSGTSVYRSEWDVMSNSLGTGAVVNANPEFQGELRYLPPGTIAFHLDLAGWILPQRRVVVPPGGRTTVTLEQLHNPSSNSNALMVRVPIAGSHLFYTVEARTMVGYDQNIPAAAVVIHLVDNQRSAQNGQALVVDVDSTGSNVNDAGARWLPGETYTDAARNITIEVLSSTSTSFTVRVRNNPQPDAPSVAPDLFFSMDGHYRLSWHRVSWATGYEIQVATDRDFTTPVYLSNDSIPADQQYYDLNGLADGIYYWRVRAKDTTGQGTTWSTTQSFEVQRPE